MSPPPWAGPVLVLSAYLLGSVSFGLIAAARAGVDLRAVGSGNVGATNAARALGKSVGRLVMLLDALKGFAPTLAAVLWLGADDVWTAGTGVAAVVGHVLPLWHGLAGGKGAATGAGALLAAAPMAGAVALIAFLGAKKLTRQASVGSLLGASLGLGVVLLHHGVGPRAAMAGGVLAIVVARHHTNIRRLLAGTEPKS